VFETIPLTFDLFQGKGLELFSRLSSILLYSVSRVVDPDLVKF